MKPVDTGFRDLGNGHAAAWINGQLTVIGPGLWADILVEREEGPRYCEAISGARRDRLSRAIGWIGRRHFNRATAIANHADLLATPHERAHGIPVDWIRR